MSSRAFEGPLLWTALGVAGGLLSTGVISCSDDTADIIGTSGAATAVPVTPT